MHVRAFVRVRGLVLAVGLSLACATSSPVTGVPDSGPGRDTGTVVDVPVTTDIPANDVPATDALDASVVDSFMEPDVIETDVVAIDAEADTLESDAGPVGTDVPATDTGIDAGSSDVAANACVAAGGTCVALAPGTCPAPGTSGGFSCGPGVGITCCVPGDAGTALDVPVDVRSDTGVDVHTDTGVDVHPADAGNPCQAAGGSCVALVPDNCPAPGMIGSATTYSCGTGLGVECCLPGDAGAPVVGPPQCLHAGASSEGWYTPSGTLLCNVSCAGLPVPACQRVGETSQGWYTTSGHGCPPDSELIVHDPTCT